VRRYQFIGNTPVSVLTPKHLRNPHNKVTVLPSKSAGKRPHDCAHARCILYRQSLQLALNLSSRLANPSGIIHNQGYHPHKDAIHLAAVFAPSYQLDLWERKLSSS
jgi:hypothetical protein